MIIEGSLIGTGSTTTTSGSDSSTTGVMEDELGSLDTEGVDDPMVVVVDVSFSPDAGVEVATGGVVVPVVPVTGDVVVDVDVALFPDVF